MRPVLCSPTEGYGLFELSPMVLGGISALMIIAMVATVIVAAVTGSQWAIAPFLVAITAFVMLVFTWWSSVETSDWVDDRQGIVTLTLFALAAVCGLGGYVVNKTRG